MPIKRARIIEIIFLAVFSVVGIIMAYRGMMDAFKVLTGLCCIAILLFDMAFSRCPHCGIHINYIFGRCCKHCGGNLYEE